jgi:Ran GTPase-activating protein (RanGAP) involved in mRNA processing and transport
LDTYFVLTMQHQQGTDRHYSAPSDPLQSVNFGDVAYARHSIVWYDNKVCEETEINRIISERITTNTAIQNLVIGPKFFKAFRRDKMTAIFQQLAAGAALLQSLELSMDREAPAWHTAEALADLISRNRLQNISMSRMCLQASREKVLSSLASVTCLTSLKLNSIGLRDENMISIALMLEKNTLQRLDLSCNELKTTGVDIIGAALAASSSLKHLALDGNYIDFDLETDGRFILGLKSNTSLKALTLSNNRIGGFGMKFLCRAMEQHALETLDISSNRLGVAGVLELSTFIQRHSRLRHLMARFKALEGGMAAMLGMALTSNTSLVSFEK